MHYATARLIAIVFAIYLHTSVFGQDSMLCIGAHWTEDEANLMMKKFASGWSDKASWEERAGIIRQGIIHGMQLEKMPPVRGNFNPVIRNTVSKMG